MNVPFFRVELDEAEIAEVTATLRSGWLTAGPRAKRFEDDFKAAVGARHALALCSGTAALHLAVEALGLREGQAVLVPAMTFAATAEVVRYCDAVPLLVDCDPVTLNLDLADAERRLAAARAGGRGAGLDVVGVMPVHVGGLMLDVDAVRDFARRHDLWVVEDAAHALPSAQRGSDGQLRAAGGGTADVTAFSFYANKTVTTGEGGMATTDRDDLAARMRVMALHGLSRDAWARYSGGGWDYRIVAPGFKYNTTDIAATLGLGQLARAHALRDRREAVARRYLAAFAAVDALDLPPDPPDRVHSWHLFPVRLRLDRLRVDRDAFVEQLRERGVGFSVHWRPLHLHPYYQESFAYTAEELPVASQVWERLVSLPIFPALRGDEQEHVVEVVSDLCRKHRR